MPRRPGTAVSRKGASCLNARDRNLLGFRRDLLTAAAYGVDELLFVYGDPPQHGDRSTLTVRQMLEETRSDNEAGRFRVGVTADVTRDLPGWKRGADFAFTQISFDDRAVARWRDRTGFEGQVYAGVVVLASHKMAIRLRELIPGFEVPDALMADLARDGSVGVERAVEQVLRLRDSGAVDGVHLVPARQFRRTADALERAGV